MKKYAKSDYIFYQYKLNFISVTGTKSFRKYAAVPAAAADRLQRKKANCLNCAKPSLLLLGVIGVRECSLWSGHTQDLAERFPLLRQLKHKKAVSWDLLNNLLFPIIEELHCCFFTSVNQSQ